MSRRYPADMYPTVKFQRPGVSHRRGGPGRPLAIHKVQIVRRVREYFLLNSNATLLELAEFLGIHEKTLINYIKRFAPLREAIRQGGLPFDIQAARSLSERVNGYSVIERKIVKKIVDGEEKVEEVIESVRHIPPSVEAAKYWLSKRNKNWQEQDESEKFKKDMETIAELLGVQQEDLPE